MSFLTNLFSKTIKAKEIPTFTNFLVSNPFFRRVVLTFHKEKTEAINNIDSYLEKELLGKDELNKRKNAKQIDQRKSGNRQ